MGKILGIGQGSGGMGQDGLIVHAMMALRQSGDAGDRQ
jgi:hypothetical protein